MRSVRALEEVWSHGGMTQIVWLRESSSPLDHKSHGFPTCFHVQLWRRDMSSWLSGPIHCHLHPNTLTARYAPAPSNLKQLSYVGHPNNCSGCSGSLQWSLALLTHIPLTNNDYDQSYVRLHCKDITQDKHWGMNPHQPSRCWVFQSQLENGTKGHLDPMPGKVILCMWLSVPTVDFSHLKPLFFFS